MIRQLLLALIKGYQKFISPLLPARCRYYPTCSQYGLQAIQWHGAKKGGWLTIKRICRCQPFGSHGIDFVPLPLYQFQFVYVNPPEKRNFVYQDNFGYGRCLQSWLNQ